MAKIKCSKKAPCNQCPFLKDSAPGYLGPWKPTSLHLFVMGEDPFPCHLSMGQAGKPMALCHGAMLYRRKCGKLAMQGDAIFELEFFRMVGKKPDTGKILGFNEFKKHHALAEKLGQI